MTALDYSLVDEAVAEPEQDDDEALELPPNQRRVLTQSLDASVESLVSRIRRGRLILQPDFQRDYVWSRTKASALIESILMRIPLPVIYVAELNDGSWEMVDGQQRLTAIRAFVDGMFPDGQPFRLGRLRVRDDLRGKLFTELSPEEQSAIEDYSLRVIMIQKEADHDLKFEVFERLNSGADKLNDMELRNCIYRGPYNDLLKELVKNETFLRIRGEKRSRRPDAGPPAAASLFCDVAEYTPPLSEPHEAVLEPRDAGASVRVGRQDRRYAPHLRGGDPVRLGRVRRKGLSSLLARR